LMTDNGTGYLQNKFSVICAKCSCEITKEKLAANKFATDLAKEYKLMSKKNNPNPSVYLALVISLPEHLRLS